MANDEIVNIKLALPPPIKFEIEGVGVRTISGLITMQEALEVRALDQDMEVAEAAMYVAANAAAELQTSTDSEAMGDAIASAQAAMIGFEDAVNALSAKLLSLFQQNHPEMDSLPIDSKNARLMVAVVWRRAFGASKEDLERMASAMQGEDDEDGAPPTKPTPSRTSRNGSTASAKRTAAPRGSGSRSR